MHSLKKSPIATIDFVRIAKQSLHKANSFACSLANRDKPVAATLQRKCSGGTNFAIVTKIITKIIVTRNYFVIISARMVTLANGPIDHPEVLLSVRPQIPAICCKKGLANSAGIVENPVQKVVKRTGSQN